MLQIRSNPQKGVTAVTPTGQSSAPGRDQHRRPSAWRKVVTHRCRSRAATESPGKDPPLTEGTPRDGMSPGDRVMDAMRVFSADYSDITVQLARWLGVHTADATAFSEIIYAQETDEPLTPIQLSRRIGLTSGATASLLN